MHKLDALRCTLKMHLQKHKLDALADALAEAQIRST
jgi:hypothetical protein